MEYLSLKKENPRGIAKILLMKKLPNTLLYALFYLFLCFGNWFSMRRTVSYIVYAFNTNNTVKLILGNEVFAFLSAGLVPLLLYILARLLAFSVFRFMPRKDVADMEYALRFFYGLGYLVYGAFSMIYYAVPVLSVYGETIIRFLIVGGAVALYTLFEAKYRMPKRFVPRSVYAFIGTYCIINGLSALILLFSYIVG